MRCGGAGLSAPGFFNVSTSALIMCGGNSPGSEHLHQ